MGCYGKPCAVAAAVFMKIHTDGLQGANQLETGRTQSTPHTGSAGGANGGNTIAGHDGDTVEISGISQQLADSNAVDGKQRENRVAELAALYAKGQYQVDAAALSQKLVASSITGGEVDGGSKK
jgi:anti-sigma28 factor (negative regulator of flagellin synthesis)